MDIPIYIDGRETGRLRMDKEGGHTVIRGEMEDPGHLVRLYLFGDGEGYLGIPQPEGGRLRFCRKLTPRERSRLPLNPAYAAEERLAPAPSPEPEPKPESEPEPKPERGENSPARHVVWMGGKAYYF